MAPKSPMEIQEVVEMVVSHLKKEDVKRCILVSKSWRDVFLPYRWLNVRAGYRKDGIQPIGPGRDALCNHRHLIWSLILIREIDEFSEYDYSYLGRLEINMIGLKPRNNRLNMNLATKTPMLVNLILVNVVVPLEFWDTLSNHPRLKRLHLDSMTIHDESAAFWRTCMKLESLQMECVIMEVGDRPRDMVFHRLRQLMLNIIHWRNGIFLSDLMLRSPMLESLEYRALRSETFLEPTASGSCLHLKKLHLHGCFEEEDLNFLFKRVRDGDGNNVYLEPYRSGLDTVSETFGSHYQSLVDVDLHDCVKISRSIVPDILCLCPRLEKLQAKNVLACGVMERGPWVCQQLRELRIQFCFEIFEEDLQPLIFERLSTLVRLEQLTLDYCSFDRYEKQYDMLECRLDRGLGRLASLQQLTSVWLDTPIGNWQNPNLSMEDVMWMVENWKGLKKVVGYLNWRQDLAAQLRSVFDSHGI